MVSVRETSLPVYTVTAVAPDGTVAVAAVVYETTACRCGRDEARYPVEVAISSPNFAGGTKRLRWEFDSLRDAQSFAVEATRDAYYP